MILNLKATECKNLTLIAYFLVEIGTFIQSQNADFRSFCKFEFIPVDFNFK